MVLAVAQLHNAIGLDRVIAAGRRSIQPHAVNRYFIDLAGGLPEVGLERRPARVVETAEDDTQAIIGELDRAEGLTEQRLECMLMALGPALDADFAVVGRGE